VLPSFASLWLLSRLPDFSQSNPEIEIRLHADGALIDLQKSDLDAAIRFGDGRYPGLAVTRLMSDFVVPACSPGLLAKVGYPERIEDLARMPLLHDAPTETDRSGSGWQNWLARVGQDPNRFAGGTQFSQANLVIEAAVRGHGVALVRWSLAEEEFARGRLVRAWPQSVPTAYSYYFVTRPQALSNLRIGIFRDWLAASCRESEHEGQK
jgi:LysR family glycine cleavage system transcriptional activator